VSFVSLERGVQSGITTSGARTARDESEWRSLWADHARISVPPPALPAVDFDVHTAVLVSLGTRATGGYSLTVEGARVEGEQLVLDARETAPPEGSILTQALTAPYEIVLVPRTTLPIDARIAR
jgi:hypothetical protein